MNAVESVLSQIQEADQDDATFIGGLDELTPTSQLKPGRAVARFARNYESVASVSGGYIRTGGYERKDGRARPSDATYSIVQVVSFTNIPVAGQTLTGGSSGATGAIIAVGSNYIAITLITGTFTSVEAVLVGATPIGTATMVTVTISALLNAQYLNLAADVYRALIAVVPGSGPVRGVTSLNVAGVHKLFAFRDNAGATLCILHVASAAGWVVVPLLRMVRFTAGSHATLIPLDGDTLTQGADTAIIRRVIRETGSFAAGDATGRLIIDAPLPTPFGAGAATIGAITLTLGGADTAISILPGGRFEFEIKNFGGQLTTKRIYGCDGVNLAFEFDGTYFCPIETKATVDTPRHISAHNDHLFLGLGSSSVVSAPGLPYVFDATEFAAEIPHGDDVTGYKSLPGAQGLATLLVNCRNSKRIIYGSSGDVTSSNHWNPVDFNNETGGLPYSIQTMADTYCLDDSGVQSVKAAQELSGFSPGTLTFNIQNFMTEHRGLLLCSCVHKVKSQYRLYFSNGNALYLTILNGKLVGSMPITYPLAMFCVWNAETPSGEEVTYAGAATGGFVYELDRGSSFDGENVDALLTLAWNPSKSPRLIKSYRGGSLEIQSSFYVAFNVAHRLGYGRDDYAQPPQRSYVGNFSGGATWDLISWDAFVWDGSVLSPSELDIEGDGENIEIAISSSSDYVYPYTLNSIILNFFRRRKLR